MTELESLFVYTTYAPWKAFIGRIVNTITAFMWTYMDVFVMAASVGLSSRFKQINENLMKHKGEV